MNENKPSQQPNSEEPATLADFYNQLDELEAAEKANTAEQPASKTPAAADTEKITDSQYHLFKGLLEVANPQTLEGKEDIEDYRDAAVAKAALLEAKNPTLAEAWRQLAKDASIKLEATNAATTKTETSDHSKTCSRCGYKNREQANFCGQCGNSFAAIDNQSNTPEQTITKVCSNCKHVNRPQARFCGMCGTALGA